MPIAFTNNWKNILDKLESIIKSEFKNSLKVCIGADVSGMGQYIELEPIGTNLLSIHKHGEEREFSINMSYNFKDANIRSKALDHILRYVSRIESLIHDNLIINYTNENGTAEKIYNCRIESTNLNKISNGEYLVNFDFKCIHFGNRS